MTRPSGHPGQRPAVCPVMADTPPDAAAEQPNFSPSDAPIYHPENQPPAPVELVRGDTRTSATIAAHLQRHLGPVSEVLREVGADKVPIDIHVVPPSEQFPFYTLVTAGMSDQPMLTPAEAKPSEAPPYAELCMLLPAEWPLPTPASGPSTAELAADEAAYWPIRWLKMLARLPEEYHTWLGFGHTVPNGAEAAPLADNTRLGCLMLLTAISLPEEFQELRVGPAKTIQFYTLYPIYPEEMALKMNLGASALLDRFEEADLSDVVDLHRPNLALV